MTTEDCGAIDYDRRVNADRFAEEPEPVKPDVGSISPIEKTYDLESSLESSRPSAVTPTRLLAAVVSIKQAYESDVAKIYGGGPTAIECEYQRGLLAGLQIAVDRIVAFAGIVPDGEPPPATRGWVMVPAAEERSTSDQEREVCPTRRANTETRPTRAYDLPARDPNESKAAYAVRVCSAICSQNDDGVALIAEIANAICDPSNTAEKKRANSIVQSLIVSKRLIRVSRGVCRTGRPPLRRGSKAGLASETPAPRSPTPSRKPRVVADPRRPGRVKEDPFPEWREGLDAASRAIVDEPEATDEQLVIAYQAGDARALDRLLRRHDRLVHSIVQRYDGRGVQHDDLCQEARLGVAAALRDWRPDGGARPMAYAYHRARAAARRHWLNERSDVRVPVQHHDKSKIDDGSTLVHQKSFDEPIHGTDGLALDSILRTDPGLMPIDDEAIERGEWMDRSRRVRALLLELPERERFVLTRRLGLEGVEVDQEGADRGETLAQIGKAMNLSRERVRQIQGDAIHSILKIAKRRGILAGAADWHATARTLSTLDREEDR